MNVTNKLLKSFLFHWPIRRLLYSTPKRSKQNKMNPFTEIFRMIYKRSNAIFVIVKNNKVILFIFQSIEMRLNRRKDTSVLFQSNSDTKTFEMITVHLSCMQMFICMLINSYTAGSKS